MKIFATIIFTVLCLPAHSEVIPSEVSSRLKGIKLNYIAEYKKQVLYSDIAKAISLKQNFFDLILKKSRQVIPGTAVYLTKKTLLDADSLYDFKSPWMLNAPLANNTHLTMETMIIMNGLILFGYSKESQVKVANYSYFTSNFTYPKTIKLRLNGTTYLHEPPLSGPLNIGISGFKYVNGKLEMLYKVLFLSFTREMKTYPIEARKLQSKSPFSRSSFY
ncbi:MAG: hypothetical protein CME70_14180 [Halobacteriovorax sp.]|nr:hypothetical protein [Halobacteriovorax sp.]|tara:strand:+ start:304607 stop:305263 length:657 start_codon:yes stop_codon:yes gene_type:complete